VYSLYDEIIEFEKKLSKEFFKNWQIFENKFDENEYLFLKFFLANNILTNKIFEVINELIINEKLDQNIKFLIFNDFLFSMSSYDIKDPSNLIFKITRNSYIQNIVLRSAINTIFNYNYSEYIKIHKKLLIGLRLAKVLIKTEIRTKKNNTWETTIYFSLTIDKTSIDYKFPLGYSEKPFIIQEIHKTKYTIGSFRNIWKVKRKKREMEDFATTYKSTIKANQLALILSSELFKLNKENIENEEKKILKSVGCNNITEYLNELKKIIKDNAYSHKLLLGTEKIEDIKFNEIFILRKSIKIEYIKIMSKFQKIISILVLNQDLFDKIIYIPCFIDNRNRQYYATLISPTFYKIFRHLYILADKKELYNTKDSIFYNKILQYKNKITRWKLEETKTYLAIVLFIEVGKHFIKSRDEGFVKTEDIIDSGIENYTKKTRNIDFEDLLYIEKIYNTLDNILEKKPIDINMLIYKDATASGIQNYGIILGYKEEMLKYINIDGDDWCDTYQYIIFKFLRHVTIIKIERKYWKKTIMTIPYNAEWFSCFIKFLEALREDGIEYNNLEPKEKDLIKSMHKKFYNDVKNNLKKEFYKNESGNLKLFKYNKLQIVNKKDYKINYKKARDKYTDILYMIIEDKEATQRALEANNMHYLDANLVGYISSKFDIISIHDCFGIRLCELHLVMDKINEYYSNIIGKKTYSIHIII
jgi:hypothetical protein